MRMIHKPVALAWRQRPSFALRARAAATLPYRAFVNNPHVLNLQDAEQLWLRASGKLSFFHKGLDVDEEFSHGGDDGGFVGFAAIAQTLDVRGDNGVAGCG